MDNDKGTLYFFTGLAGAGKSAIGGAFYKILKEEKSDAILLDGDSLRKRNDSLGLKHGYTTEERLNGAWDLFSYCRDLTNDGHDVVLCSICMYKEVRCWARENIENYKEIYIKVPMDILYKRDQGALYSSGAKNVVGVDLMWDEPTQSNVVIENDGEETPEFIAKKLQILFGVK